MPDGSESKPPSKVNIISIASDDDLWVLTTDQNTLSSVLADPVGWVSENVQIGGNPAVLWQPFVVVFQQITGGGNDPTILVQGINETALLTVQYAQTGGQAPSGLFPVGSTVSILTVGQSVYAHLELEGFTPAQVTTTLITAVSNPTGYFEAFNALPQTVNGTAPQTPLVFKPSTTTPIQFTYQGWTPQSQGESGEQSGPISCDISLGDSDPEGNVWVNNVIIKTYSPTPSPSPSP